MPQAYLPGSFHPALHDICFHLRGKEEKQQSRKTMRRQQPATGRCRGKENASFTVTAPIAMSRLSLPPCHPPALFYRLHTCPLGKHVPFSLGKAWPRSTSPCLSPSIALPPSIAGYGHASTPSARYGLAASARAAAPAYIWRPPCADGRACEVHDRVRVLHCHRPPLLLHHLHLLGDICAYKGQGRRV